MNVAGSVYLVEDDPALSEALLMMIESAGLTGQRFENGESFLAAVAETHAWASQPGCVVLDIRMQRLSGLEVFEWLTQRLPHHPVPVIFLTGHADVSTAVQALKRGAFDFCEKPFNDNRLIDRIREAIALSRARIELAAGTALVRARLTRLSTRERAVMEQILLGKLNKVIAADLGISMRTVEVHRANIFEKMEVRSAVELARLPGLLTQGAGEPAANDDSGD